MCVITNNILCIGTHLGTVWLFEANETNTNFNAVGRMFAHDEAITFLDGFGEYIVTSSDNMTYMWKYKNGSLDIIRRLNVMG